MQDFVHHQLSPTKKNSKEPVTSRHLDLPVTPRVRSQDLDQLKYDVGELKDLLGCLDGPWNLIKFCARFPGLKDKKTTIFCIWFRKHFFLNSQSIHLSNANSMFVLKWGRNKTYFPRGFRALEVLGTFYRFSCDLRKQQRRSEPHPPYCPCLWTWHGGCSQWVICGQPLKC